MADTDQVRALLAGGSHETIALLPLHADDTLVEETLVALANSAGGTLVLHGSSATTDPSATADRVITASLATEPRLIIPIPQALNADGLCAVVATVPEGLPHVYATSAGRYLMRAADQNVPVPPRELRRLMLERGGLSFESEVVPGASRDDLDWPRVQEYVERLGSYDRDSAEDVLLRRGCLVRQGQALRPTNAGILLFGKDPARFIRSADITAVRFASDRMGDKFSRQDIGGTLIQQIKRAEAFLFENLRRDVTLGGTMARQENYEYPMEAARELVINAIAHRDYSLSGDNIRLLIFSNRMEIHSPGGLPGYMTLENLREERFSRNPIIVQVLSDLYYIERLGYGVDRVMELMQSRSLRAPEFRELKGSFCVTLYNTPAAGTAAAPPPAPAEIALTGTFQGVEINPRQEAALQVLLKNEASRLTNSDLQSLFPDVHSETIRRDLVDLVNKSILVKLGQKRGSYYVLRREGVSYDAVEGDA